MIVIDTETLLITPDCIHPPVVCLTVCRDGHTAELYPSDDPVGLVTVLTEILDADLVVGHNVAFDLVCIALKYPSLLGKIRKCYAELRVADTEDRERLYSIACGRYREEGSERGEFALGTLATRLLDLQLEGKEDTRLSYGPLLGRPLTEYSIAQIEYAKMDAIATYRVYEAQESRYCAKVRPSGYKNDRYQARRRWCAAWAAQHGMGVDPARVGAFEKRISAEYEALRPAMERHGIVRWHQGKYSKNVKEIQRLVENAYPADGVPQTPRGQVSTNELTLKESDHPLLLAIADYQHVAKMLHNDLPALRAAVQHRQRPYYRLLSTGRVQGSKPNLMNVPTRWGVRDCYVPPAGYVYVDCDYSGLELCTWAQVCLWLLGHSRLAEFLNADLDAHLEMARQLLDISYDAAKKRLADGDPEVERARKVGKQANFGLQGGMGLDTFRATALRSGIRLTIDQAEAARAAWRRAWPEAAEYLGLIDNLIGGFGRTTTIEQLVSGRLRGDVGYTQSANTYFQGLAADGMIYAWWLLTEATMTPGDPLYGSRTVGVIHDQFLIETPEALGHEAALRTSELMVAGMAAYVPAIKIKAEPFLTKRWLKKAKQRWVGGRLTPYDPE